MAYNLSEEDFLKNCIELPDWVLFYHREKVKRLLPFMAEAYLLVARLQREVEESLGHEARAKEKVVAVRLNEKEIQFCETFAKEQGLSALLDHLGLDGLGNEVVALYRGR